MFRLTAPPAPRWIELPENVRVRVRPLQHAERAAMLSYASRHIASLRRELADRREIGAPTDDLPDLDDPDVVAGVSSALVAEGLARALILEWEGVGDEADNPLPLTPDTAAALARTPVGEAFAAAVLAPLDAVATEGNASPAGPAGAGAPAGTTAPAAPPPTSPPAPAPPAPGA